MVLVDYCKAFDMVDNGLFLDKLKVYAVVGKTMKSVVPVLFGGQTPTCLFVYFSTKVNNNLEITCNGSLLANVMNVKLLGLEIDEELSFSEHITTVCKKVAQRIGLLK